MLVLPTAQHARGLLAALPALAVVAMADLLVLDRVDALQPDLEAAHLEAVAVDHAHQAARLARARPLGVGAMAVVVAADFVGVAAVAIEAAGVGERLERQQREQREAGEPGRH
jgi:hypothetical protein